MYLTLTHLRSLSFFFAIFFFSSPLVLAAATTSQGGPQCLCTPIIFEYEIEKVSTAADTNPSPPLLLLANKLSLANKYKYKEEVGKGTLFCV